MCCCQRRRTAPACSANAIGAGNETVQLCRLRSWGCPALGEVAGILGWTGRPASTALSDKQLAPARHCQPATPAHKATSGYLCALPFAHHGSFQALRAGGACPSCAPCTRCVAASAVQQSRCVRQSKAAGVGRHRRGFTAPMLPDAEGSLLKSFLSGGFGGACGRALGLQVISAPRLLCRLARRHVPGGSRAPIRPDQDPSADHGGGTWADPSIHRSYRCIPQDLCEGRREWRSPHRSSPQPASHDTLMTFSDCWPVQGRERAPGWRDSYFCHLLLGV